MENKVNSRTSYKDISNLLRLKLLISESEKDLELFTITDLNLQELENQQRNLIEKTNASISGIKAEQTLQNDLYIKLCEKFLVELNRFFVSGETKRDDEVSYLITSGRSFSFISPNYGVINLMGQDYKLVDIDEIQNVLKREASVEDILKNILYSEALNRFKRILMEPEYIRRRAFEDKIKKSYSVYKTIEGDYFEKKLEIENLEDEIAACPKNSKINRIFNQKRLLKRVLLENKLKDEQKKFKTISNNFDYYMANQPSIDAILAGDEDAISAKIESDINKYNNFAKLISEYGSARSRYRARLGLYKDQVDNSGKLLGDSLRKVEEAREIRSIYETNLKKLTEEIDAYYEDCLEDPNTIYELVKVNFDELSEAQRTIFEKLKAEIYARAMAAAHAAPSKA